MSAFFFMKSDMKQKKISDKYFSCTDFTLKFRLHGNHSNNSQGYKKYTEHLPQMTGQGLFFSGEEYRRVGLLGSVTIISL